MQPYFFPSLAHFALIAATDEWVVFDVTQYTRKSWMNRNRILHPKRGWHYVSAPVKKASLDMKTSDAQVTDMDAVHKSLRGKLSHYKKSAPHYRAVLQLVDRVFEGADGDSLASLNVSCLKEVCSVLSIFFPHQVCSQMGLHFPDEMGPGDWAPSICKNVGASAYINPVGGRGLFDPLVFEALGIELYFLQFSEFIYKTPGYGFEPGLSILDVLMWKDVDSVKRAIKEYTSLLEASA
jgi:hypothetical protein